MDVDADPIPVYLLSVPRLARPPSSPFLAGLLLPFVLVAYALALAPRLLLVLLLLIVRFLMVGLHWCSQLPIVGVVLALPALLLFIPFGLIRTLLQVLLDWNLLLSGVDDSDRLRYVTLIIGPVVGTQD